MNSEKGMRVVFKKNDTKFLMRITPIFPVKVYLLYHSVNR